MIEHKTKILAMLAEGKIDVSEAEKLLDAVDSRESAPKREISQQFFNIFIDSKNEGGTRVKIKVPLRLLKAGMKFANLIPEESRNKIQTAMRNKGIKFNLDEMDSLNIDELLEALQALDIAVEDGETSETIRIFCG